MQEKLIDQVTSELLKKFGSGGHIPGSGSAAALNGMLAANLTCTVIDLTENHIHKSNTYKSKFEKLQIDRSLIKSKILLQLEFLFENDSIQFDKVIEARKARDLEKNKKLKLEKEILVIVVLRKATEIPIKIAEYCYTIGKISANVFDFGFRSARGDSATAIETALAGMSSSLSIINLNLQKIPVDPWFEDIRQKKQKLEEKLEVLKILSKYRQDILKTEAEEHYHIESKIASYKFGNLGVSIKRDTDLEKFVIDLQNTLWSNKGRIWKKEKNSINLPTDILKPQDVLEHLLNYTVVQKPTLGNHYEGTEVFEIAGLIDKSNRSVEVSQNFSFETMRFTLAHELGHALLHNGKLLHRDKGIDGSILNRNAQEIQADKFAAYFLMPKKLVSNVFQEIFEMPIFKINENTVLELGEGTIEKFKNKCGNLRGLSRKLVDLKRYGRKGIIPISEIFGVSTETMAIRLEELGLVEF